MAAKATAFLCAQILLAKVVYGQVCGVVLNSGLSSNGLGLSNSAGLSDSLGLSNSAGQSVLGSSNLLGNSNLGLAGSSLGNANLGSNSGLSNPGCSLANLLANTSPSLLDQLFYGGSLSIASGSSLTPSGISLASENLLAEGSVAICGNLPLVGAVNVDGSVCSAGEGAVHYNTNSNVGLTSGGCGAGLGGANLNAINGLGGGNLAGLGSSILVGLSGANSAYNGVNYGGIQTVGC